MKTTLAATVAALTALGVMLARTSREPQVSGQSRDEPVDAPPSGSLRAASGAPAAPLESSAPSQPQGGARLPRSEPASSDAPNAAMPSARAVPPPDGQAALQQLVVQSQQGN